MERMSIYSPDEIADTPIPPDTPILSVEELEQYKTDAILARDRLVGIINCISSYRVLNHRYLPITRAFVREIEARDLTDMDRYVSLPQSFAFVMALNNKECRKMGDPEILSNFFGENCDIWMNAPETIDAFSEKDQVQIFANYEYMAYIVLNACDELAFNITK